MKKFSEFGLSDRLLTLLGKMGYKAPTEIQEKTLPVILEGRDILASSQTGSGKTGAFLIPLIAKLEENPHQNMLVITPTRELAKQVYTVANQMAGGEGHLRTALLIGGEAMFRQTKQLKAKPRIVIGTPGRLNDHLQQNALKLNKTHYLVLDETDRMLDMGFGIQINSILEHMPVERQTVLFSATLPKAIVKLSADYLVDPVRVAVGNPNAIADKIQNHVLETDDKFETLCEILNSAYGAAIVFVRTQRNADNLKEKLKARKFRSEVLHGGLRQSRRASVMKLFRDKKVEILVATDVAARGIDVPHVEHVVNYHVPDQPEDYIHRIGRTARAEKTGEAFTLLDKGDGAKWKAVQRFLKGQEGEEQSSKPKKQNRRGRSANRNEGKQKVVRKSDERKAPRGEGNSKTFRKSDERRAPRGEGNSKTFRKSEGRSVKPLGKPVRKKSFFKKG